MKLIFKGKFKGYDQLPTNELPDDAVQFKEPSNLLCVNLLAIVFIIPVVVIMGIALGLRDNANWDYFWVGYILSFLMMVPHEIIHALCAGKDDTVYMYYSIKHLMMFVAPMEPMTKTQFVVFCIMPAAVLGIIPFLIGLIFCPSTPIGSVLISTGMMSTLMGGGDFMNIFFALTQMPKGSLTQLSGMHSYWFMPKDNTKGKE